MITFKIESCNKIFREAAKITALSLGKINKYEYLTDEEILTPDWIIE